MNKSTSLVLIAILMSGCTSPQHQRQTIGSAYPANAELIEVYVPGSTAAISASPGNRPNPLLNPRSKPPAFREPSPLPPHCMPGKLATEINVDGNLVDSVLFDDTMRLGYDIALDRHLWRFNVERTEAQTKVVAGNRAIRPNAAPRPSPVQQNKPLDLSGLFGNSGQQRSRPGMRSAAEINAMLPNFEQMRADLQHNQAVLAQQDAALRSRENRYAEQLLSIYQQALQAFASQPAHKKNLETLNRFDRFRQNHVDHCLLRVPGSASGYDLQRTRPEAYNNLARMIIADTRLVAIRQIDQAKSTTVLQEVFSQLYSTPFLRGLAEENHEIAAATKAKSGRLEAHEAQVRQLAIQQAAAEAVRQANLKRKRFLDNAAKNIAPSEDEVVRLVSQYVMEKTNQRGVYGRLERISPTAFDFYTQRTLIGDFRQGSFTTQIHGLNCKPEHKRQKCQFSETRTYDRMLLWPYSQASFVEEGKYSGMNHEVEFFWTEEGLQSPELKRRLYPAGPPTSSSAGGPSSEYDNYQKRQDQMNEHYDNMRDRSREEAEERQRRQDEIQRQWQQDQERRREMNSRRCPNISDICN